MPTLLDLQQKRNNLVSLGRSIFKKAEDEKRAPTDDEKRQFDEYMNGSDQVKAEIDAIELDEKRSKRLKAAEEELRARPGRQADPIDPNPAGETRTTFEFTKRRKDAEGLCAVRSMNKINLSPRFGKLNQPEARTKFAGWLSGGDPAYGDELRNLQVDLDTAGGFLVTPQ